MQMRDEQDSIEYEMHGILMMRLQSQRMNHERLL